MFWFQKTSNGILLLVFLFAISRMAHADTWSFVVAGDGRTNTKQLHPDPTGINTPVLKKLLQAIVPKKPEFLLFTGDLVSGENAHVSANITDQFESWKSLVKETAPNLTVLPVRGNHETYGDLHGKHWLAAFKPVLDKNNVSYLAGEEGFSYFYVVPHHPEVVVIALDQFMPTKNHRVNLVGLQNALQQAKVNNVRHIFVVAHEMAFTCTSHPDSENMTAFPAERNKFLSLLKDYGCEYFFAGHDHTYDWMAIKHSDWPSNYALNQIVAGTAGAPFYPDKGYFGDHDGYTLTRLDHEQNTYGYLLVVVNDSAKEKKVTVTFEPVSP